MLSPLVLRRSSSLRVPADARPSSAPVQPPAPPVIATIVVTHDRLETLALTLKSIDAQTLAPTRVVVVDSGSTRSDPRDLLAMFPHIEVITVADNVGYGAALAIGIEAAQAALDPDYYWIVEDDSPVEPDALAAVVTLADDTERMGVIGNRGGHLRVGLPRPLRTVTRDPQEVDYCSIDGALISRTAVEACGTPRRDFFMMHEDREYTTRIKSKGLRVLVADAVRNTPLAMGATQAGPVFWRDYYQSRNHLRYVLDRHSVIGIVGWAIRETAIVGAGLRRGRPGLTKTRMVLRGARDAARNEMGRTVEPGSI